MRFGRYDLIERIGTGGMAEVFLAVQRGPRGVVKRLVIKRITPARAADPRFVTLFEQEARVGCDLSHGNLVSVFEFGRVGDRWFMAMEHVDGCDLGGALAMAQGRGAETPAALIAHVAVEVCRGLAHLHARGYVHRDVTPRNVLVSWDGQVKLSDYGLALARDHDGAVRGTPRFMAPEQAAGAEVDARADLYAVGAVIAYAACDAGLAAIAARATALDPAARYASADALRAALEPIAAGVDDRALAAWLAGLRPDATSLPAATSRAARTGAGSVVSRGRARRGAAAAELASAATAAGSAVGDPLAPLDALLAGPARPRRRRRVVVGAAALAILAAAVLTITLRSPRAPEMPVVAPARCLYGEGYYCGRTLRPLTSTPEVLHDDVLYVCDSGQVRVKEVCEHGCQTMAPGEADICRWREPRHPAPSRGALSSRTPVR